jgi:hypothetical protein
LEAIDLKELESLCEWLEAEGLQAIGTRVSTGDECSIVIEDGVALGGIEEVSLAAPAGEMGKDGEDEW